MEHVRRKCKKKQTSYNMFRKFLNIPKNTDTIEATHTSDDLFSPAAAPTSPQLKDPRLLPPKIIPHKYNTPSSKYFENKKTGVKLYYEVYGSGKEHVIFIVGLGFVSSLLQLTTLLIL